jgi:hypothetical protein
MLRIKSVPNLGAALLGVSANRGKWKAQITNNGKQQFLGRFATPEQAYEEYLSAKKRIHEGCSI